MNLLRKLSKQNALVEDAPITIAKPKGFFPSFRLSKNQALTIADAGVSRAPDPHKTIKTPVIAKGKLVQQRRTLKAPSKERSGLLDIHDALQSIKTGRSGLIDLRTANKSGVIEISSEEVFSHDLNQMAITENKEEKDEIGRGSRPELVLEQLQFTRLLGTGSFGSVHLAKFKLVCFFLFFLFNLFTYIR
jgi:hypothetical protein